MLARVVVENGVKKLVPLTADCGSGNPCGAIITVYQRTVPNGYLPLGAQYDITQFPVLYSILGTDTIPTASALGLPILTTGQYVIKATSGINENQADNVLSALSPVNTVANGDMHSVTSNAVYDVFQTTNAYGYIPLLKVNRIHIDIGDTSVVTAELLQQYLGNKLGGGFTIVDIDGTYKNTATMFCNCVSEYNTNNVYGFSICISYYQKLQQFRLHNGTWSLWT